MVVKFLSRYVYKEQQELLRDFTVWAHLMKSIPKKYKKKKNIHLIKRRAYGYLEELESILINLSLAPLLSASD